MSSAQKILIIGFPGSGKTSLARVLEKSLGHPLVSADDVLAEVGTIELATDEISQRLKKNPSWIYEGRLKNFGNLVWPSADIAILIQDSFWICWSRYMRRELRNSSKTWAQRWQDCIFVIKNRRKIKSAQREVLRSLEDRQKKDSTPRLRMVTIPSAEVSAILAQESGHRREFLSIFQKASLP